VEDYLAECNLRIQLKVVVSLDSSKSLVGYSKINLHNSKLVVCLVNLSSNRLRWEGSKILSKQVYLPILSNLKESNNSSKAYNKIKACSINNHSSSNSSNRCNKMALLQWILNYGWKQKIITKSFKMWEKIIFQSRKTSMSAIITINMLTSQWPAYRKSFWMVWHYLMGR
jgi:hypothetical protein